MNVLITSASRKVSLVRAFQDAVAGSGHVIAVDCSPYAAALYRADRGEVVSRLDDPMHLEQMLALCRQFEIDVLVPTRDDDLRFYSEHRSRFIENGIYVHVASQETVATCLDKSRFAEFLDDHDFPAPVTYGPDVVPERFPVFAKPRRGSGAIDARRINRAAELTELHGGRGTWIIQEWIEAPEYTVDVWCDLSGVGRSAVPRERIEVVAGESFVSRTESDQPLQLLAIRLAEELGIVGHAAIQFFMPPGRGPLVIEANARYGGGSALSFAAGAPSPTWLLQSLRGSDLDPLPGPFKTDLTMLRFTDDVFIEGIA